MTQGCDERAELSKKVAAAIASTYRARRDYDGAKSRSSVANLERFRLELDRARAAERDAHRALKDHIETHQCKE